MMVTAIKIVAHDAVEIPGGLWVAVAVLDNGVRVTLPAVYDGPDAADAAGRDQLGGFWPWQEGGR